MATLPTVTNQRVLRSEILVDKSINSRKSTTGDAHKKKIAELAASMRKTKGPMFPPLLMRLSQAGKAYEGKKETYLLIAGFRRQEAMDEIGITEYDYRLAPSDWTLPDAMGANLTENLAREDLTGYETAMQCHALYTEHGKSYAEIAAMVKADDAPDSEGKTPSMSKSHVENLVRLVTKLPPAILKAWRDGHAKASIKTLLKIAGNKNHEDMMRDWKGVEDTAKTKGAGKGKKGKGGSTPRPSVSALGIAIARVKESEKDPEWKKGALAALNYAAGLKENIPGIKLDAKPAKEEDADDVDDADDADDADEGEGEDSAE